MEDKFANHTYNPEIRFRGYTYDWEQRKFSDYYRMSAGYAFKMSDYCDDGIGLINGESIQHGMINDINLNHLPEIFTQKYPDYVLKEGDIVVGLNRPITNGNLKIARIPSKYNDSLLYQRAGKIVYKQECDKDFTYVLLSQEILKHTLVEAVGSDQPFISTSKLDKWQMMMPDDIEEQQLIGTYFLSLDNLITLHQRKCDMLKNLKASMLTKMFPKEGESVPEIRFKGFTEPWEQRKVQDVADRFDNLRIPVAANLRVHGTTPYYGANGIQDYVDGFTHDGEFVLVAEDGANDLKNYPVKCVNGRVWVNNHAHVLQGKARIADNRFLAFAISQSDIESLLVGGGRAKLNAETLMSIEFRLPCLQEQYRIGEYLSQLDNLITLHQRKYEKLLDVKKAFLEKMIGGDN